MKIIHSKELPKSGEFNYNNNYGEQESSYEGKYPVLFKKSGFLLKIIHLYFGVKVKQYFRAIKPTVLTNTNLQKSYIESFPISRICFIKDEIHNLNQKSRSLYAMLQVTRGIPKSNKNQHHNRIFIYIIKKRINKAFLCSLSSSCERFVKSIISEININLPKFVYDQPIPKSAYELIGREDIYMNRQLYPRVRNNSKKSTHHARSVSRSSMIFNTPSFISGTPNSPIDDAKQYDSSAYSGMKISKQEDG